MPSGSQSYQFNLCISAEHGPLSVLFVSPEHQGSCTEYRFHMCREAAAWMQGSWTNCSSKHGKVMYSGRQHALCGHDGAVTTTFVGGGSCGGGGGGRRRLSSHSPQRNGQPSSSFSSRGLGSGAPAPVGPKRLALASCERLGLLFGSFFFSVVAGDCCFAIIVSFGPGGI